MRQITAGTAFEASPSFLITALGNRIAVASERGIRKALGLSLLEWRVLEVLAVEPAAPPGRIIAVTGVNKANVSRAVSSLEQRGYLRRAAAPDHGKRTHLYLTLAGQGCFRRGSDQRAVAEEALLDGLPPKDRDHLCESLKRLMRNMERITVLGAPSESSERAPRASGRNEPVAMRQARGR